MRTEHQALKDFNEQHGHAFTRTTDTDFAYLMGYLHGQGDAITKAMHTLAVPAKVFDLRAPADPSAAGLAPSGEDC